MLWYCVCVCAVEISQGRAGGVSGTDVCELLSCLQASVHPHVVQQIYTWVCVRHFTAVEADMKTALSSSSFWLAGHVSRTPGSPVPEEQECASHRWTEESALKTMSNQLEGIQYYSWRSGREKSTALYRHFCTRRRFTRGRGRPQRHRGKTADSASSVGTLSLSICTNTVQTVDALITWIKIYQCLYSVPVY